MLRRGVPIAYVSRQLGHASISITADFYGHFVPGADRHHVEGLAEAIEPRGNTRTHPRRTQLSPKGSPPASNSLLWLVPPAGSDRRYMAPFAGAVVTAA